MKTENILGTEKINKLVRKFSIPCIISMVVNSLYNIVDQIFIGWGVGYLGNGATNIVFPIVVISLAFSLMIGDGTSSYLSLKLGEKKYKEAKTGVANGILISILISLLLCILCLIFLPNLLNLFGCTDNLREYAKDYGYIISIGLPFMIIGTTLNSIIRADGSPRYAMTSMVLGAILNIALDPIFIFIFKMGVKGAALATIISQFITFVLNIIYIKKFKTIKITKKDFKINYKTIKNILLLGISSFITQMSVVIVISVQNNMLAKYGIYSKYGSDIPITVIGIVMKINQILNSIIIGISVGSAPIIGYNYGANKLDRVKETLKVVIKISLIVGLIAFILFQTIPDKLITLFGNGNKLYIEFACMTFRIMLILTICNAVQMVSGIFFQAIGKSIKSAILSLSRQILFLVPAMLIMSKIFGVMGVLYAGPIADSLAFIISLILLIKEIKLLGSNEQYEKLEEDITNYKPIIDKHIVVTISREYGSGGRYVGRLIAQKLGIKFYDKDIIKKISENTGLSEEYIRNKEQRKDKISNLNIKLDNLTNEDTLFIEETKIIKELADKDSCVIIGRCADNILKDRNDVIKVFISSSYEDQIKRVTELYKIPKKIALKEIKRINKLRSNHYKYYTGNEWRDINNYDISLNSDVLGVEKTAEFISNFIINKIKN